MSLQYRTAEDEKNTQALANQAKSLKEQESKVDLIDIFDDAFQDVQHVKSVYSALCEEYNQKIVPKFGHLTKAKSQVPPYWDDAKNCPAELPMNQHNVCSGRFTHSICQISLTYNSFFPNESYTKSLLDIKIVKNPFGKAPSTNGKAKKDSNYVPTQTPKEDTNSYMFDQARTLEQGYDNVIKNEPWAKSEHLKMVSDMMNYGVGIYYYDDPQSYKYKTLDYRKCRFPSGTTVCPEDWEYMFIEHDMSFNDLVRKYKATKEGKKQGWNKAALSTMLEGMLSVGNTSLSQPQTMSGIDAVAAIDNVREGFKGIDYGKVFPARIPLVSCFWKQADGKIGKCMFPSLSTPSSLDSFLYTKDSHADSFCDIFSVFPGDETEDEIRMVRGWGEKIHPLSHAYDRAFCKFLDHLDYSATMFVNMDPNDVHKKILHFGSVNIGKIDSVQNFPSALQQLVGGLALLDAKIDSVTFTRGLNKTELMGDGRGAELASIILTVEGRIHKHLNARFSEHLSKHYRTNLAKIIKIALKKGSVSGIKYPEIASKFTDYIGYYGVELKDLQYDDTSYLNYGLPSNWIVVARKPDSSGIGNSPQFTVELLRPFFSSLPEAGFRYMLARIIADAFGDEDMIQKLLPDSDTAKVTTEADIQMAETQAAILTNWMSDFDGELTPNDEIDPKLADGHKFMTLPASRENDHAVFLQVFLAKIDDAVQRMNRREIGRTTLHIWMYNLVSSAQAHVELLRADQVRSERPEAAELFKRFGTAFNMLRQVESQANADRAKKFDALSKNIAEMDQNDPKRIEATAKLEMARAKTVESQTKASTAQMQQFLSIQDNRRAEEAHIVDQGLKRTQQTAIEFKAVESLNGNGTKSQTNVGRPGSNTQ